VFGNVVEALKYFLAAEWAMFSGNNIRTHSRVEVDVFFKGN
jgi:hypothetical protein